MLGYKLLLLTVTNSNLEVHVLTKVLTMHISPVQLFLYTNAGLALHTPKLLLYSICDLSVMTIGLSINLPNYHDANQFATVILF